MDAAAQPEFFDFPVIDGKTQKRGVFAQYVAALREHGFLFQIPMVAAALNVSRERVHQLVGEGRLAAVQVGKHRHIPAVALELFLTEERKNGRPFAEPRVLDLLKTVGRK